MKSVSKVILLAVFAVIINASNVFAGGPKDPAGKGNGILGFGAGPGMGWHGDSFGPAFLLHYDHGLWKGGPGTISLGGQFGVAFYGGDYTTVGFVGRAAYHYGWNVPGLDTYAGFGAGSRISTFSDGHNDTKVDFLPTAFFGASYFFTDIVGANCETGYNFAYISIGLNFRIVR